MPHVMSAKTVGYDAFISGRDVDSAMHREDGSEGVCVGIVGTPRAGDEIITEQQYQSIGEEIAIYNAALPSDAPAPQLNPDTALLAAISAARTLDDLKRALTGADVPFSVSARNVSSQ